MKWRYRMAICSPNVYKKHNKSEWKKIVVLCNFLNFRKKKLFLTTLAGVDFFGRTPRSESQCQSEGGTCEFFALCWITGGLLQGTCNNVLQGCCHRTAKSSNLGAEAGRTFDLTDLPYTDYGPVINDPSECTYYHLCFLYFTLVALPFITSFYLHLL